MSYRRKALVGLLVVLPLLMGSHCAESEVAAPSYEVGEPGVLIVRNPSPQTMAIGGCNPVFYEERLPGRWVPDGFIRPACAFGTREDGQHEIWYPLLIPPHGEVEVQFPTGWLLSTPGIMRVLHRVSVNRAQHADRTDVVTCGGVDSIVTDPIVIFEAATTTNRDRRPPGS